MIGNTIIKMGSIMRKLSSFGNIKRCMLCSLSIRECNQINLTCGHSFHRNCIRNWFTKMTENCPNCRKTIDPALVCENK